MFAVIGAGFAGLAAAWHLSKIGKVILFDSKGIGAGASGAATGLLHPYPGEKGRRSWEAKEALEAARVLLKASEEALGRPVAHYGGVLRETPCMGGDDVEEVEGGFLIRSGITVFVSAYLEGLWKACQGRGVELVIERVKEDPKGFEAVIWAVGAGVKEVRGSEHLNLGYVKGQALTCQVTEPLERSRTGKRSLVLTEQERECLLGSTYEREFTSDAPCLETAIALLKPHYPVRGVMAGVRVTNRAHYFPILERIGEKRWVITALGSRGLLYHALLAEKLMQILT